MGDQLKKLRAVEYCSRFALGFFYDKDSDFFKSNSWSAKFISDDIVRFFSLDHRKRNASGLPTIGIHTTKEFGKANIDKDSAVVQPVIVQRVQQLFPELPPPTYIKPHKWRYSQVENSYAEGSLVLSGKPILMCGGDGFTQSNFEGCVLSAENIVENLVNLVKV